jgi:hypothetical protein
MTSDPSGDRTPQSFTPPDTDGGRHEAPVPPGESTTVRQEVVAKEKEQFGGVKIGSAFFGWLTATGTLALLSTVSAIVAVLLGYDADAGGARFTDPGGWEPGTVAWVWAIVGLVVLFVSYLAGGYVAGRMARFNGARQGLAVWLWAVLASLAVTIAAVVIDTQSDVGRILDVVPQTTFSLDDVTAGTVVAALLTAAATLIGAIVGGSLGMRFHRRVDKAGLGH